VRRLVKMRVASPRPAIQQLLLRCPVFGGMTRPNGRIGGTPRPQEPREAEGPGPSTRCPLRYAVHHAVARSETRGMPASETAAIVSPASSRAVSSSCARLVVIVVLMGL